MNIPDEVIDAADAAFFTTNEDGLTASYRVIAEWARKEALREAETAVRPTYRLDMLSGGETVAIAHANHALHNVADRIKALVGGDKTDD